MRKFFTLIMMVMMTISASADEVVLYEGDPLVCDNWSGVGLLSDSGTELKNECAQAGDKIKIYADVSSASEGWQLQVCEGHWDKDAEGNTVTYASFSQDNGDFADGTATFELTEAILTRAFTKSWWGNSFILNGTGGIKVNKVSLIRAVSYPEEGKSVTFDDSNGFIAAEQFAGLHERSKVIFTYTVSADPGEKTGWGIGRIGSNDDKNDGNGPSVTMAEVPANAAGEHTLTLMISDINKGLAATPEGIVWQMWNFDDGAVTATRVKIEIFEATVDGETATALWTAAGVETIFGSSWGAEDAANDMTSEDGINYTLTKENVTLEKGIGYEFKILKDHAWTEAYPAENYSFSVEETAVYTVAITFNADTKEITVTTTKTGEAGSHAEYPLASKVERIPPLGKEEASGSCCTSSLPSNSSIMPPLPSCSTNPSCFSAVPSVNGWNQCV